MNIKKMVIFLDYENDEITENANDGGTVKRETIKVVMILKNNNFINENSRVDFAKNKIVIIVESDITIDTAINIAEALEKQNYEILAFSFASEYTDQLRITIKKIDK